MAESRYAKYDTPAATEDPLALAPSPGPVGSTSRYAKFDQPPPVAPPVQTPAARTLAGTVKDIGLDLTKGLISVPEAVVGIADIPTGGRVGKALEGIDFRPAEAKQILEQSYSPARQAAGERFEQAEGVWGKLKAAVQNPSVPVSAAVESAPMILGGGLVARGLGKVAPVLTKTDKGRALLGAAGEGVMAAGSGAEQVRQETEDGRLTLKQSGLTALSGLGTMAFGYGGGRLAQKLGIADPDMWAAGFKADGGKKLVRRTLEGALSEGLLEELPQSIQEQVLQNAALERDLSEGVDAAAVLGALSGGLMGGTVSALSPGAVRTPKDVKQKINEIATFKAENPEVELSDAEVAAALEGTSAQVETPKPAEVQASAEPMLANEAPAAPEAETSTQAKPVTAEVARIAAKLFYGSELTAAEQAVQTQFAPEVEARVASLTAMEERDKGLRTSVFDEQARRRQKAQEIAARQAQGTATAEDAVWVKRNEQAIQEVQNGQGLVEAETPAKKFTVEPSDEGWVAKDASGKVIGTLATEFGEGGFGKGTPERPAFVADVKVDEGWRRQGVASALYEQFSSAHDGNIAPAEIQTDDGAAFWRSRKPSPPQGAPQDAVSTVPEAGSQARQEVSSVRVQGGEVGNPLNKIPESSQAVTPQTPASQDRTLKKNQTETFFTVDSPSFAGNVFVERTTKKRGGAEVKELFVRDKKGEFKKASDFIVGQISKKTRVPYEGAKFDEAQGTTPLAPLQELIQRETGLTQGTFTEASAPKGSEAMYAELSRILKKRIVFFAAKDSPVAFNAVTGIPTAPDTLFINIAAKKPHLALVGHEFLHDLRRESPEDFAALHAAIMPTINETERQARWGYLNEKRAREGRPAITLSAVDEELVADFFGEQFLSKEFWAKVERKNPDGFAGIVQRLLDFIDRVKSAFVGRERGDIDKAREVAAEALARYVRKTPLEGAPAPQFSETLTAFYSRLEQAVQAKMGGKMTSDALKNMLKNNGVTDDEIGTVLPGLDVQKVMSKQEVLDEIRANGVELEDVVLGEPVDTDALDRRIRELSNWPEDPATAKNREDQKELDYLLNEWDTADQSATPTHFSTYVEPGAVEGSYREMFVTAPKQAPDFGIRYESQENGTVKAFNREGTPMGTFATEAGAKEYFASAEGRGWKDGHSQYDQIQNPIVRLRFNERQGPKGERILFIEEMQGPSDANQQKMPEYLRKRIYDLGVKRALAYAKENGFDGVAWTTGEMQANRYDLSKQVEKIEYWDQVATSSASGKESRAINIDLIGGVTMSVEVDKSGEVLWAYGQSALVGKSLDEVIGKDLAKQILEASKGGTIEGEGLSIGGEGLKSLYDKMLPSLFKKYGREGVQEFDLGEDRTVAGTKVTYEGPEYTAADLYAEAKQANNEVSVSVGNALRNAAYSMEVEKKTFREVAEWDLSEAAAEFIGGKLVKDYGRRTAPGVPVTDRTPFAYAKFSEDMTTKAKANIAAAGKMLRDRKLPAGALKRVLKVTPEPVLVEVGKEELPQLPDFYNARRRRERTRAKLSDDAMLIFFEIDELAKKAGVGREAVEQAAEDATFHQIHPDLPLMEQDWVKDFEQKLVDERAARLVDLWEGKGEAKYTGKIKGKVIADLETAKAEAAAVAEREIEQVAAADKLKGAETLWRAAKMDASTTLSFQQAYRKANDSYEALGTTELKMAYLKAVDFMTNTVREREKNALQKLIEEATETDPALRAELLGKLEESFRGVKGAYWPMYREGDYILEYVTADGRREVDHFESEFERSQAQALLERGGVTGIQLKFKDRTPPVLSAIPAPLMEKLKGAVEAQFTRGVDPQDTTAMAAAQEKSAEALREMTQIWLRFAPETSALKNSIQRKNVLGWSTHMLRGFLRYTQSHAMRISQLEEGRKIEAILESMSKDIKGRGTDTTRAQIILNDLRDREAASKTIKVGKAAQTLGRLTTFWYMTSPSIALVQMTQLGVLTYPKLAVMYGPVQAARVLTQGIASAFSKDFSRDALYADEAVNEVIERIQATVTPGNREEGEVLGAEKYKRSELLELIAPLSAQQKRLAALRMGMELGLMDISLQHELGEIVRGDDPNAVQNKVQRGMMSFMRLSETASRKAAILAAYDAATASGKDFFEALKPVDEVVEGTLFNYSKDAKGVALQSSTPRVLLTFQTFRIMAASRMILLFRQTFKAESAEVKAAARNELLGIFGTSGLLAGVMGMPFAPILFKLMDMLLGDDDEPVDHEADFKRWLEASFGETAAGLATEGAGSLLGAALSRRIGLGDVIGSGTETPAYLHGEGALAWWTTQMLGPSYAMVAGWARGYDQMVNEGEVMKGLAAASPKPLKDALRAYGMMTDGVKTGAGKRLLSADEIDAEDIALMAVGIRPQAVAKVQDDQRSVDRMGTEIGRRRGQLVQDLVKAFARGEDTTATLSAVEAFNEKMPAFAIGGSEIRSAMKTYARGEAGIESKRERNIRAWRESTSTQ